MTITITETDFDQLCQQAWASGEAAYYCNNFEVRAELPKQFGRGCDRSFGLRNGLKILMINGELWQPLSVDTQHDQWSFLISKFYLSGSSRVLTPGVKEIKNDYQEISGHNYLYYLPNLTELEVWSAGEQLHVVMVYVELDFLRSFSQGLDSLPKPLRQLLAGEKIQRFHQPLGITTPAMQQVLQQILNCPYQGMTKQMYLEGKALELLTLQFIRWAEDTQTSAKSIVLRPDDIERLHQAKHILIANLENPPSLMDLAQLVGVNDRKLKQGFRQVFGTTVFGYFQAYRMEQAKQLLQQQSHSVAGVAHSVGYTSPSRFCDAFKRQFGITPKAYQMRLHSSYSTAL